MYHRKLLNVTATLPTSACVALREHVTFVRMLSFNFSVRKCFIHSNNKQCIVPAHTSCFGSSPRCDYPNRHVSAPTSTRTGLLRQRRPTIKTFSDWQTSVTYCSRINEQSGLYTCSTVRHFSSQSKANEETKLNGEDVTEEIYKRIIFMNDDIVVINKPYGLSVYGSSVNSERPGRCFIGVLDQLKDKLHCPELEIGLSLKSFYSGVMILCKHKKSKKQVENILAGVQSQKIQFKTYLAITVGVPQCPHGVDLSANIMREHLHNREMSTVLDTYNHTAAKEGRMIKTYFNVQPLAVNSSVGAALVQVTINKDKWEAVEVIMSHYLSPVLGDHIYSGRTQLVKGIPFVASPHAAVPGPQRLPSTIAEALESKMDCGEKNVPFFVHCHKVVLNRFPKRSSPPMILTAPPQEEFLTTLQCLGLYQEGMFS